MTRTEIVAEVARRLGDESTGFKTLIDSYFQFALYELAQRGCISQLRKVLESAIWTASTMSYNTATILGLSTPPAAITKILVPAWGFESGYIHHKSDDEFDLYRLQWGYNLEGRPDIWRLYPNETQIQFYPLPDGDSAGETVSIEYWDHPTVIASGTQLTEIQIEDVPTLIAMMYDSGLTFNDATRAEVTRGAVDKETLISRMLLRQSSRYSTERFIQSRYRPL